MEYKGFKITLSEALSFKEVPAVAIGGGLIFKAECDVGVVYAGDDPEIALKNIYKMIDRYLENNG